MPAQTLHDPPVVAPVLGPGHHVVITRAVDAAELASTLLGTMGSEDDPGVESDHVLTHHRPPSLPPGRSVSLRTDPVSPSPGPVAVAVRR